MLCHFHAQIEMRIITLNILNEILTYMKEVLFLAISTKIEALL